MEIFQVWNKIYLYPLFLYIGLGEHLNYILEYQVGYCSNGS